MTGIKNISTSYFSFRELGIATLLAVLAVLSGTYGPRYLLPGGSISGLVHGVLNLPGPGTGVLVFGGILCFWLVLGLLMIKKPGTAVLISLIIIAIDLLIAGETATIQSLDVLLFVALIVEVLALVLPGKFLNYAMPVTLGGLGAVTLILAFTGQAKMGENGAAASGFAFGYVVIGIVALCCAIACYRYPVKYLSACAFANMYYVLHFWLFWGTTFADRLPVTPDIVPVLFCVAAVGGVLFATAAYGVDMLLKTYTGLSPGDAGIS